MLISSRHLAILLQTIRLYSPRPARVGRYGNRPVHGLQPLLISFAAVFLTAASSPAAIVRIFASSMPAMQDRVGDTVNVVSFEPTIGLLSGIASAAILSTAATYPPFLGPVWSPTPFVTSDGAAGALDAQGGGGKEVVARAVIARMAGIRAIREIAMAAFVGWILSFVAWQVHETSPRQLRRRR